MVKADPSQDYYGDLDLAPGASEADIKKAFKKLALKYHPDRNPGREGEVNSKFQTINTAHEVLTDPEQRLKYDASRRAGNGGPGAFRPAGPGTFTKGNPWAAAGSQWAPPPKRESAKPKAPPASAGAQRYTSNFKTPNAAPTTKPPPFDPEQNKRNFEAWNNMRNGAGPQKHPFAPLPPRAVPKEYTPQSGREESNSFKHAPPPKSGKPGYEEFRAGAASFGKQASPQRPPPPPARKSGFAPYTSEGDEAQAPRTSAYFTRRDSRPSTANGPEIVTPPPFSRGKAEPKFAKEARFMDDEFGTPLGPRVSTPYARQGGEKLDPFDNIPLTRAKSSRERPPDPFSPGSDRHRSLSPRTRAHRHVSPDTVPRAGSDANLRSRGNTSPKRTYSTANRNGASQGKGFFPSAVSDSESSEDDIQPQRPIAKGRIRRTGPPEKSRTENAETLRKLAWLNFIDAGDSPKIQGGVMKNMLRHAATDTGDRNDSASSGGAKGPSPAYASPSCALFHTFSSVAAIHEDSASLLNGPKMRPKPSFFLNVTESAETSSEVHGINLSNTPASEQSSAKNFPAGDTRIPSGSLNSFERQQFRLLERLVKGGSVNMLQENEFESSLDSVSSEPERGPLKAKASSFDTTDNQSYPIALNRFKSRTLRTAYDKTQGEYSLDTKLGSPLPRKLRKVGSASGPRCRKEIYNVEGSSTDHHSSSFSFKAGSESERAQPYQFTSNSEENINTNFTPSEWKPQFGTGDNYFAADPGQGSSAASGTRSGRRSPTKRRPVNRSTAGNGNSIPPIDPDILKQPVDEDGYSASPGGTKFKPEEWAKTFRPQTFEFPPNVPGGPTARRAPPSRRSSKMSKGPNVTRTTGNAAIFNEDSSSDDPVYMKTEAAAPESSGIDSPNAMDIDPPVEHRQARGQPRNVPVEPTNPAWRDEPNGGRPVPDPPLPPRSPNANNSIPRSKEGEELNTKLDDLRNVEPLHQASTGLNSFNDLNSQLPWASRAATFVPLSHSVATGKINLPLPPKAPQPPAITADTMRPIASEWSLYIDHFKAYMNAYRIFDEQMVAHFYARRVEVNSMGGDWIGEFSDAKLDKYEKGLGEDKTIRAWWDEAARRHAAAMQEFRGWKESMRGDAGASRLN